MPTKPNFGGQQQPYVPKGSGDPSGEYADDQGANVNFKAAFTDFGKKKAEKPSEAMATKSENQPLGVTAKKENGSKPSADLDAFLKKYPIKNKNVDAFVRKSFSAGTPESQDFLLKGFGLGSVSFERPASGHSQCRVSYDSFVGIRSDPVLMFATEEDTGATSDYYAKGAVFYHESAHAIDYLMDPNSLIPASATKRLSNGKTLEGTINNLWTNASYRMEEAKKDVEQFKKDLTDKNETLKKAIKEGQDYTNKILEMTKPYDAEKQEIDKLPTQEWLRATFAFREKLNSIPGYKEAREAKKNAENIMAEETIKIDKAVAIEFADVSDMFEASTGNALTAAGHGREYWHRTGTKGTEFFAEYVSAKATNPASYARILKYFPEQSAAAEELYQKVLKGDKA